MNALFALALLASPLRAGVVMPVESGVVSPAGPTVTGLPVLSPSQGSMGAPSWGGIDLRGALPMLPSPVPGLAGPALNFIGQGVAPEAAAVAPQTGAPQAAPTPNAAAHGRRAEQTPALPAKTSPGSSTLAISRDRKRAAAMSDAAPSLTNKLSDENAVSPRVDAGRKFFDLGSDKSGEVEGPSDRAEAPARGGSGFAAGQDGAGSYKGGGATVLSGGASLKSFTGGGKTNANASSITDGETLQDAVASVPGAAVNPAAGGKVSFFQSAAPNGALGAAAGSKGFGAFGMPKPLALDLSATGLIVRVRSALNSAMSGASFAAQPSAVAPIVGPSTALLERGGMLEAFATAQTHAASGASSSSAAVPVATPSITRRIFVPASKSSSPSSVPSLWWALLTLPLFVAAVRRVI